MSNWAPAEPAADSIPMPAPAPDPIVAQVVDQPRRQRVVLPVLLFIATCVSTYTLGGPQYSLALMTILLCHEFGHYIQARRYHVPASLPYFIPMPFSPIGTMGAVIGMRGNMGNRKTLFDIGISGPLAGLVPTLICCYLGLQSATIAPVPPGVATFGDPLLLKFMSYLHFGALPTGWDVMLNPLLFAGWVGLLITALNLIPIGQLDGGHILYALLGRKAHFVARTLLMGAIVAVALTGNWGWSLMIGLLILTRPEHPPTGNDHVPLGTGRTVLGWLALLFVIVGFTPQPFSISG
jgi:membrane-associated protease RseP (regulator of RpoE activity)